MKKFIVFVIPVLLFGGIRANAQCNSEVLSSQCIPKLATGYNFVKSYKVEKSGKDFVEYSYFFTKGTEYMINVCAGDQNPQGIVVTLYDSKRNQVASNKAGDQYANAIVYRCNAPGIYYIQYTFDQNSPHCGGSALGFKR
jgi:hypothetical protein